LTSKLPSINCQLSDKPIFSPFLLFIGKIEHGCFWIRHSQFGF
jgi:hypothetical protein